MQERLLFFFLTLGILIPLENNAQDGDVSFQIPDSLDIRYSVKNSLYYNIDEDKIMLEFWEKGEWRSYKFLEGPLDLSAECSLKDLVGNETKELIIRWSRKVFGSGGGYKQEGIQIWSLDSIRRLFKTTYHCEQTAFGRRTHLGKNYPGYKIDSSQKISFGQGYIFVEPLKVYRRGPVESDLECSLDFIDPGTYKLSSAGELTKISSSALYIKSNEEFILDFQTQNNKRLVIAKDTSNKYLVYRFGTDSRIELEYPTQTQNSWEHFKYSWKIKNGGIKNQSKDLNYLYFTRGRYKYVVYQEYTPKLSKRITGIRIINSRTKDTTNIKAKVPHIDGSLKKLRGNNKINKGEELFR